MPKVRIRSIHVMFHVYNTTQPIDTVFLSIETTRCHLAFFFGDERATTDDHKTCRMCSRAYIARNSMEPNLTERQLEACKLKPSLSTFVGCMSWRYMHVLRFSTCCSLYLYQQFPSASEGSKPAAQEPESIDIHQAKKNGIPQHERVEERPHHGGSRSSPPPQPGRGQGRGRQI